MSTSEAITHQRDTTEAWASADGHFGAKGRGQTVYHGPLTPLPLPTPTDTAAAAEMLHETGAVTFSGVLNPSEIATLRAYMESQGGPDEQYDHPQWCFNKHVSADWHQRPELLHLVDRQPVLAAARAVLGDDCQVSGGSMWITGPGREMGLHVDWQPLRLPADVAADPRVRVPIFIATAHYYLDDLTMDFGPTTVIPCSHRAGRPPDDETTWNGQAPQALLVSAGDCVLFRNDLWHGAALNRGPKRRYLIQVHYQSVFMHQASVPATQPQSWDPRCLALLTPQRRRLFRDHGDHEIRGTY